MSGPAAGEAGDYYGHVRSDIAPVLPARLGRVLEVGCGAGGTMGWLKRTYSVDQATGVEIDPEAAAKARGTFDTVLAEPIEAALDRLPLAGFDTILALDVLEHLVDPWAVTRALKDRLAPGGAIVVSLPHVGHHGVVFPLLTRGAFDYADDGLLDRTHLRFFSADSARALLTGAGFTLEAFVPLRHFTANLFWWLGDGPRIRWLSNVLLDRLAPKHLNVFHFLMRGGA